MGSNWIGFGKNKWINDKIISCESCEARPHNYFLVGRQ